MKETNIYEIAKIAGVSPSTVSKVINDYKEIGSETKKKVLQIMKKLNYVPNITARSLVSSQRGRFGKKGRISIAVPQRDGFESPLYANIFNGITREVNERELDIFTDVVKSDYRETVDIPRTVRNGSVDGVLILGNVNEKFILQLIEMKVPIVLIGHAHYLFKEKVDIILGDNIGGAYTAVKYLLDMGHRKIGLMGPGVFSKTGEAKYNSAERIEGYKLALIEHDIEINEDYIEQKRTPDESIPEVMDRLLKKKDPPTAVSLMSDSFAIGAKETIESHGLKIPDDISIVGFMNYGLPQEFKPAITTVDLNMEKIGRAAVKRLLEIVDDENSTSVRMSVAVDLIEKESVKKIN